MEFILSKILFLIFIAIDLLLSLLCLAIAIWLHASQDLHSYMTVFVLKQSDKTLLASAGMLLFIGLVLALLCVFGALTLFIAPLKRFTRLFVYLLPLFIIIGLIAGFLPVGLKYDIFRHVKSGMKNQLINLYTPNNTYSRAWNRVQVKKRCCGVDGAWDYLESNWYASANPDQVNPTMWVPDTCCALNFNQDRELYWVDPENVLPKDRLRCNQDAWGYVDNSANLNRKGCFAALFTKNTDVMHDQSIWTIIDVLTGFNLMIALFQIVVMIVGFFYLSIVGMDEGKR